MWIQNDNLKVFCEIRYYVLIYFHWFQALLLLKIKVIVHNWKRQTTSRSKIIKAIFLVTLAKGIKLGNRVKEQFCTNSYFFLADWSFRDYDKK